MSLYSNGDWFDLFYNAPCHLMQMDIGLTYFIQCTVSHFMEICLNFKHLKGGIMPNKKQHLLNVAILLNRIFTQINMALCCL